MADKPGYISRIIGIGEEWVKSIAQKSFSLLPMQSAAQSFRRQGHVSDDSLLRAYAESPWLHIKLIRQCSAFASLGFKVFARDAETGDLDILKETHPLWMLLRNPNPYLRGWDFRFLSELYVRAQGEVYWHLRRGGLQAREMWVYPKTWVRPIWDNKTRTIMQYQVTMPFEAFGGGAIREAVAPEDMLWLRMIDPMEPYSKGLGDVLALATELDTYELASESDRRFFQNDATPAGALVVPGQPNADEVARIRDDWQAKVGGPDRQGSVPILAGGMDFKQFRQGRKEMDFIEGQRFLRDVIISGVHKHIIGISDDVTFASAKAADYTFAKWDFAPHVRWWEDNVNMGLAPRFDVRAYVQWDNPIPADEAFELDKASKGLMSGAITRNEWRKTNGYDELPKDQGDVYILPLSLIEVPASEVGEPRETPAPDKPTNPSGEVEDDRKEIIPKVPVKPNTVSAPEVTTVQTPELTAVAKQLRPDQIREVLGQLPDETREFLKRLEGAYEETFKGRWDAVQEELGTELAFNVIDSRVRDYIRYGAYPRIVGATETMHEKILSVLEEQVTQGGTITDMARAISNEFEDFRGYRALRIARQESLHASNAAAFDGYRLAGIDRIEWLLAPDYDATEDDAECGELEGEIVVAGENFPGTDVTFPPLHIQCRCTILPVIPEADAEAREVEHAERGEPLLDYTDVDQASRKQGDVMPLSESAKTEAKEAIGHLVDFTDKYTDPTAIAQWVEKDLEPMMERWAKAAGLDTKPFFTGVEWKTGERAAENWSEWSPHTGKIMLNHNRQWDGAERSTSMVNSLTKSRTIGGVAPDIIDIDVLFHEIGHAIVDALGGEAIEIYGHARPVIEGLNMQLGHVMTRSFLNAAGREVAEEGTQYLAMKYTAIPGFRNGGEYFNAVFNMRALFTEAGINLNDERNLFRALKAAVKPSSVVNTPRLPGEFVGLTRNQIRDGVANNIYAEFSDEMSKRGITAAKWRDAMDAANTFMRVQADDLAAYLK